MPNAAIARVDTAQTEGCDYFIPLAPRWLIGEKSKVIARSTANKIGSEISALPPHLQAEVLDFAAVDNCTFGNPPGVHL